MRPLSEQDHYEVLEISRDATEEEIERAYRVVRATYTEDSLAGYSVFGDGDAAAIGERIEGAYRVLADPTARLAYDAALSQAEGGPLAGGSAFGVELPELCEPAGSGAPSGESQAPSSVGGFDVIDDESGEFDGARLRRSRLHRGMELEDISSVTKINPTYLRFIEEDRFADLPAPVYVRGFVSAYAACIGLDAARVAASYMRKFRAVRGDRRRGPFAGGR